ncbi:MFS transporter [Robbsia andropogonis]|uniref:MFS transporter n=1 Tax=Robbsia andropogonis TaxID=28092 RepID=UPI003D222867
MPQIGSSLGSSVAGLQWIVDAYTLAFTALLLTAGSLADRYGSKRVFSMGLILFGLASLACAVAPSIGLLISARAIQGVGAALILPTSLSLLSHACAGDHAKRAHAIGWWSAIGGAVSGLTPVPWTVFGLNFQPQTDAGLSPAGVAHAMQTPAGDNPFSLR